MASRTRQAASRPVMSRKCSSSTCVVSRRSSPASEASRASRTTGSSAMSSRNRSRGRTTVSTALSAVAVADRGAPSSRASSPKTSPGWRRTRIASSPALGRQRDLHLARDDDEQRVARIAGVEDDLAAAEPARRASRRRPARGRPDRVPRRTGSTASESTSGRPSEHRRAIVATRPRRSRRCPPADTARRRRPSRDGPRRPLAMAAMTPTAPGRLRLTVLGCSTAAPHAGLAGRRVPRRLGRHDRACSTPARATVRRLQRLMDPTQLDALVIGHMHADHYLDLVGLRYLFPWGEAAPRPLPVHLPPGGRDRLDALATRSPSGPGSSTPRSTRSSTTRTRPLVDRAADDPVRPRPALRPGLGRGRRGARRQPPRLHRRHRARATRWSRRCAAPTCCSSRRPCGLPSHDDPERGHLTRRGGDRHGRRRPSARSALLVHYAPGRRAEIEALCAGRRAVDQPGRRRPDRHGRRRPTAGGPRPALRRRAPPSSAAAARDR